QVNTQQSELEQQRTELERERQQIHWDTKIQPPLVQHENKTFESLLAPYQKRLNLDKASIAARMRDFKTALKAAGEADKDYMRQMKIFRNQRNPDPAVVNNFVKNAITNKSKAIMDQIINENYGSFLK